MSEYFDLDDEIYLGKKAKEKEFIMAEETVKNVEEKKVTKNVAGLDVGTGFIVGAGFNSDGKVGFTPCRDAFFEIDADTFKRQIFNADNFKIVQVGDSVNIIDEDALTIARMLKGSAKRPLSKGVINPSERAAAPILKEMFRYVTQKYVTKGGKVVFSVPGKQLDNDSFNVNYHEMSLASLCRSFGYEAEALNEAYAVVLSEISEKEELSGIGLSFGAGLVNACFVYKGMLLFNFSINKSGDFIDQESASACGTSESQISKIKEKNLDLRKDEIAVSPEERALMYVYRYVIQNVISEINKAFSSSHSVNIEEAVPVIVSGGTSLVPGFMEVFQEEAKNANLPFEITLFRHARDPLTAVANGCLKWAIKNS